MKEEVRRICEQQESVALPTLIELTDGSPGDVFLATRRLYHDGVLIRVGPGRYQFDIDADSDETGFEWNTNLESK